LSQSQAKLIAGMSHFNHSKASHNMWKHCLILFECEKWAKFD
jgi:hypothetical protein